MAACRASGVRCIVDMGTSDLGRKIGCCGDRDPFEHADRRERRAPWEVRLPAGDVAQERRRACRRFLRLATAERWGAIGEMGTGSDVPMDADERKALLAAAKLQQRTGLPIVTHVSDVARCALDQVDLFESAGVSLNRVVIGHLNDIKQQPTVAPMAIAKRGAYVAFDHCGKPDDPRADEYVRTILTLLDAGLASASACRRTLPAKIPAQERRARHRHDRHRFRAAAAPRRRHRRDAANAARRESAPRVEFRSPCLRSFT